MDWNMEIIDKINLLLEEKWPIDLQLNKVLRAFRKLGFEDERSPSSHIIMKQGSNTISIPAHKKVKSTILKQLCDRLKISLKQFMSAL